MRKTSKFISMILVLLAVCTFLFGKTAVTYAANNIYSLSTDDVYIAVNEGRQVFVKNLLSSTSAIWTSEDESIATVKSNGIISGVKVGETVVTAKIGKVKLKCKVHVMWPDPVKITSNYLKTISYTNYYMRSAWWRLQTDKTAYEITNTNDYAITIKAQLSYMADGRFTGCSKVASVTIPANDTGILFFDKSDEPKYEWTHSTDFHYVSITKSKSKFLTSKVKVKDKQLKIGDNPVAPVELTVKNNSGVNDVNFYVYVMYYNAEDRFVGMEKISKKLKKGTTTLKTNPSKYVYNEEYESEFKDYTYDIFYVAYK